MQGAADPPDAAPSTILRFTRRAILLIGLAALSVVAFFGLSPVLPLAINLNAGIASS